MRYFFALFAVSVAAVIALLGFRGSHFRKPPLYIFPDMEFQLKLRPQAPSGFFPNGRTSQLPVPGTIARAVPVQTASGPVFPFEDAPVNTGWVVGTTNFVEHNPLPITSALLKRGQQRYTINCAPCHGGLADGNGITRKIGAMAVVANLHDKRIVEMPDGELFYVITHGRNLMGPYGAQVSIEDRWAVVAYLRALQLARLGEPEDLPPQLRTLLK
ncbi:MAG TPA: cytochrome c [Verrucomicrobiota bacterium]|jgi:mono/diheme cytochrome c family protein|nr:cytochrome c [Verrucomicrobiota bacterium]HRT10769.1 cytochrome c [Candidatus Paceibacterota bacterium]HRT57268.1 cytochrome c [Candidatus Paceibacterota bacterium]